MFDCTNTYDDVQVRYTRTSQGSEYITATIDATTYDIQEVAITLQRVPNARAVDALMMYLASGTFYHTRNMEMFADCVRLIHAL